MKAFIEILRAKECGDPGVQIPSLGLNHGLGLEGNVNILLPRGLRPGRPLESLGCFGKLLLMSRSPH